MNKEDLIKHIAEYLEKGLPENLVYRFSDINFSTGYSRSYNYKGDGNIISTNFNVEINFVGIFK